MTNHTLQKQLFRTGAALCGIAVILGAFASHYLRDNLSIANAVAFEIGVRYQFIHGLAFLFLASFMRRLKEPVLIRVNIFFLLGVILFCGSLYVVTTRSLWIGDAIKWIGGITPLGGISFIIGWGLLAWDGYKQRTGIRSNGRTNQTSFDKETES